jgi:uncharacterized membrane protein YqjE
LIALGKFGTTLLALLGTRIELLGVELREETLRVQRILVVGIVAAFCLGAALLLASALLVLALWDRYQLLGLAAVTALYAAIGGLLLAHVRSSIRSGPAPFSATVRLIEEDLELLRERPAKS